jgi:hypothetical protein
MISLAAALLLAAAPAAKVDYQGPLGLKWGMSPEAVKGALSKRLEFVEEKETDGGVSFSQYFAGTFGDFAAEKIEVTYWERKLLAAAVVIAPTEERPVDLLWQQVVASMSSGYGPPTKMDDPLQLAPGAKKDRRRASVLYRMTERSEIERALLSREARVAAKWRFRNGAECLVGISADPDATEIQEFRVMWAFADGTRLKGWDAATDKAKPPDF